MTSTGKDRVAELLALREKLNTLPHQAPALDTRFFRGVEGIQVQLVDGPSNPYRAMVAMATSTWGSYAADVARRWDEMEPEYRFAVVRSVMSYQALPLAMEAAQFTFTVSNVSRWSFDQIARARIGVVFASLGTRDNNHSDVAFRFHDATFDDPLKLSMAVNTALIAKSRYGEFVKAGVGSWQEARTLLPISCCHRFAMSINYAALRNLCSKRMSFSEAEDTVAVAWLLRERLLAGDAFPYLAAWLRPGCDYSRACGYHKAHTMAEAFGCLYKSCGRNPVKSAAGMPPIDYEVADFNEACSDRETMIRQLGIEIPEAGDARPEDITPEDLSIRDRWMFGFPPRTSTEAGDYAVMASRHPGSAPPAGRKVNPMTLKDIEMITAPVSED